MSLPRLADFREQLVALGSVTCATGTAVIVAALKSGFCASQFWINGSPGFSQVALANREAVEGVYFSALVIRFGFGPKVIFEIFPVIAALIVRAEGAAGIVATVHHAVFATRIAGDSVDNAVFVPVHFFEHLTVTSIMAIGHHVAGRFPAFDIAGRNCPGGAGEFALAGQEFLVNDGA